MTYQEAIESAKKVAKYNGNIEIVFCYKRHWWSRKKYGYCSRTTFFIERWPIYVAKLLTITPTGTIKENTK